MKSTRFRVFAIYCYDVLCCVCGAWCVMCLLLTLPLTTCFPLLLPLLLPLLPLLSSPLHLPPLSYSLSSPSSCKVQLPLQHCLVSAVLRRARIAREYNKRGGEGEGEGEEDGEEEGESKYTERPHTRPSSSRLLTEGAPLSVRVLSAKDAGDTLEVVFSKVCVS